MRRDARDEHGAIAVVAALAATAMFLIGAMVVDLGLARDVRGQSQASADSAALAGGNVLYPVNKTCTTAGAEATSPCFTDAVKAARSYAETNFNIGSSEWTAAGNGCTTPTGYLIPTTVPSGDRTACVTFDSATKPQHIRVQMPNSTVKTGLGTLAGVSTITVASEADAIIKAASQGKCALCFLSGVEVGNGDFDISGSSVHVNGDLQIGATSYWKAAHVYVAGTWQPDDEPRITPAPERAEPITDPFATDPKFTPSTAGLTTFTSGSPCTNGPGIYNYDYTWGANEDCTISSGLYVVNGKWELKNNSGITGNAVTLYVPNGELDFKNSGKVDLRAPNSGSVAGFVIVYGRNNTHELGLQGNGTTTNDGSGCNSNGTPSLQGGVYMASGVLSVNGVSCLSVQTGPIVVNGVTGNSSGDFNGTKSGLRLVGGSDVDIDNQPKGVALYQ
jgi:hypothetical protein